MIDLEAIETRISGHTTFNVHEDGGVTSAGTARPGVYVTNRKEDLLGLVGELRLARDVVRAARDLLSWDHGSGTKLRHDHRDANGKCASCGGDWPCPPFLALDALDAYGRHCWVNGQQTAAVPSR